MYTSTVCVLLQPSQTSFCKRISHLCPVTSYPSYSLSLVPFLKFSRTSFTSSASFLPLLSFLTISVLCNGMHEVFVPKMQNFFDMSCPFMSASSFFRILISILLHLSGSLDTLLCDMIALPFDSALFLLIAHTLYIESFFLSYRLYSRPNFQPFLFLCLNPILTTYGSTFL